MSFEIANFRDKLRRVLINSTPRLICEMISGARNRVVLIQMEENSATLTPFSSLIRVSPAKVTSGVNGLMCFVQVWPLYLTTFPSTVPINLMTMLNSLSTRLECPNCAAKYELVRVEAPREAATDRRNYASWRAKLRAVLAFLFR